LRLHVLLWCLGPLLPLLHRRLRLLLLLLLQWHPGLLLCLLLLLLLACLRQGLLPRCWRLPLLAPLTPGIIHRHPSLEATLLPVAAPQDLMGPATVICFDGDRKGVFAL
jgi:hypothetical protein